MMFAASAQAMTAAECDAAWTKADTNTDGFITETEAARYYAAARNAGKPFGDKLAKADFLTNCQAGMFEVNAKTDPEAPLKGANSFTENQARDRAVAFGLTDVTGLKKDEDGIWRGTGKLNGNSATVAIDYKGNVVAK